MLAEVIDGCKIGITSKKHIGCTKISIATATSNLESLLEMNVWKLLGKGRNTTYQIIFDKI